MALSVYGIDKAVIGCRDLGIPASTPKTAEIGESNQDTSLVRKRKNDVCYFSEFIEVVDVENTDEFCEMAFIATLENATPHRKRVFI